MSEEEAVTTAENVDEAQDAPTEEATTAEVDAESEEAAETEEVKAEEKPKPTPEQRKIAELSYKTREQNRQIERLLKAVETQSKAMNTSQAPKAPKIEDFDSIDEYIDAKLEYKEASRSQPEVEEVNESPTIDTSELYEYGMDKYADFADVVGAENVSVTPAMANAIIEIEDLDVQVDTAYFLGTNPREAARISKLSPVRQIAAIAKLEDKFAAKPAPKPKQSAAPAPIKPVGGSSTRSDEIQPTESFESFMKKRNKQLGRT